MWKVKQKFPGCSTEAPAIGLPARVECKDGNGFPSKSVAGCNPEAKPHIGWS
jgi:hypothetical protein